jgi:hypothetical protein
MTIHVRYLSQVIVKMSFEGACTPKTVKELDRFLDEQIENAKKPLFYLIDLQCFEDAKESEEVGNLIADKLAERGKIIQNIAFVFKKKKKIKNKEIKDKIKTYDREFDAHSWLSDQSRFGFYDEITVDKLVDD